MNANACISAILPSEEGRIMSRRRHQNCPVKRTKTVGGKNDQWYIRYRIDVIDEHGNRAYREAPVKYLGYCRDKGIRQAERERDEFLKAINDQEHIIPSQMKFGAVLDRYLVNLSVEDSTVAGYKSIVTKYLRPVWGETRMCDIRQIQVETWLMETSRTLGRYQFRRLTRVFEQAWNCAVRWEYTHSANPISVLPKNFGRPKPGRTITLPSEQDFRNLIAAVRPPWQLAAQIMMYTGLRVSEVLGLRWMDFENDAFFVRWMVVQQTNERKERTKTAASKRPIPVTPGLRSLVSRPAGVLASDFIFPAKHQECYLAIKKAAAEVGIDQDGFGPHMFRRGFNTFFRRAVGVEAARRQLGHTDARTNDIYFYPGDQELAEQAAGVDLVMGKVSGRVM